LIPALRSEGEDLWELSSERQKKEFEWWHHDQQSSGFQPMGLISQSKTISLSSPRDPSLRRGRDRAEKMLETNTRRKRLKQLTRRRKESGDWEERKEESQELCHGFDLADVSLFGWWCD
jgi:hypothetical protein